MTTVFWSHQKIYWWIIIACSYLDGFPQIASQTIPLKTNLDCHWWPSSSSTQYTQLQHSAKDKVIGSTADISWDLSLLWSQIFSSSYRKPKCIGTICWAVFRWVKVLGQGPEVCLRVITRCSCSAPQDSLAGHCLHSPSPLTWQAWVWSWQGSSGPSQKGLKNHMSNNWRTSQGATDWNDPTYTSLPGRVNGKTPTLLKRSFIWSLKTSHRQPTGSIWYHDLLRYQMPHTMVPKGHLRDWDHLNRATSFH